MNIKALARYLLRRAGFDVVRFPFTGNSSGRRALLLRTFGIEVVIDIGANIGQYACDLRNNGFNGTIVSFEPLPEAFRILKSFAEKDGKWWVENIALSNTNGTASMHVAANSVSSSILDMLAMHEQAAPESGYVRDIDVEMRRLDDMFASLELPDTGSILMKVDTQGYERHVLEGAGDSLRVIDTLEIEMSLAPLYREESLFWDLSQDLREKGYVLVSIERGMMDYKSGRLLQVDGLFHRFSERQGEYQCCAE